MRDLTNLARTCREMRATVVPCFERLERSLARALCVSLPRDVVRAPRVPVLLTWPEAGQRGGAVSDVDKAVAVAGRMENGTVLTLVAVLGALWGVAGVGLEPTRRRRQDEDGKRAIHVRALRSSHTAIP